MLKVGDKVVCINDDFYGGADGKLDNIIRLYDQLPKKGAVYIVREIVEFNGKTGILLEEIKNKTIPSGKFAGVEPNFAMYRFRKRESDKIKEEVEEEVEEYS